MRYSHWVFHINVQFVAFSRVLRNNKFRQVSSILADLNKAVV